jgi:hypothetical protein
VSVAGVGTGFKPSDTKKLGIVGPSAMTKVGSGIGMNFKGPERVTDWTILRNEEMASSGLGKSTSIMPESSDELGLDLVAPVRAKEGPRCSSGGRGDLEEGVSPSLLVVGSTETLSERVGESRRSVCLGSECLGLVVAP